MGHLLHELVNLGGAGMIVSNAANPAPRCETGVIRVGVDWSGVVPDVDLEQFDILISSLPDAPAPWVGLSPLHVARQVLALQATAEQQLLATTVATQVIRIAEKIPFSEALPVESLAYSMLLNSAPFRAWRAATPVRERANDDGPRVRIDEIDGELVLRLDRPETRNAFDARMRDELAEALAFATEHPDSLPVVLTAEGPAFSGGGDLNQFGSNTDPGIAHLIRTLRSPARLVHELGPRLTVRLHGACIGAGIEVPAAAALVTARQGTFFRLPEVSMGLIPGAGGTVAIPRRIGRHRACYMAISGADIDLATALSWGLVDMIEP